MNIKTSTANPLINLKLQKYQKNKELLLLQRKIFTNIILLHKIGIDIVIFKDKLIDNMIGIEKLQFDNYDKNREESINNITRDINEIDLSYKNNINELKKEIYNYEYDISIKLQELNKIDKQIPDYAIITNYKSTMSNSI